jgi:hypothetical protein
MYGKCIIGTNRVGPLKAMISINSEHT